MMSQGRSLGEAIRAIGVAEATYHRWRNEFGGLKLDQVRRLKELELESSSAQVLEILAELMLERGVPEHIRSDHGSGFVAQAVRDWIAAVGSKTAYIKPGSPWESGYVASFNSKLGDELLNGEIFCSLREAQVPIEVWWRHNNAIRPHSALRWTPPAPEVRLPPQTWLSGAFAQHAPPHYH